MEGPVAEVQRAHSRRPHPTYFLLSIVPDSLFAGARRRKVEWSSAQLSRVFKLLLGGSCSIFETPGPPMGTILVSHCGCSK